MQRRRPSQPEASGGLGGPYPIPPCVAVARWHAWVCKRGTGQMRLNTSNTSARGLRFQGLPLGSGDGCTAPSFPHVCMHEHSPHGLHDRQCHHLSHKLLCTLRSTTTAGDHCVSKCGLLIKSASIKARNSWLPKGLAAFPQDDGRRFTCVPHDTGSGWQSTFSTAYQEP